MLKFIALDERRNNRTLLRFVKFCKTMTVLPEPSLASYAVAARGYKHAQVKRMPGFEAPNPTRG
jgi:hypothetical protein